MTMARIETFTPPCRVGGIVAAPRGAPIFSGFALLNARKGGEA